MKSYGTKSGVNEFFVETILCLKKQNRQKLWNLLGKNNDNSKKSYRASCTCKMLAWKLGENLRKVGKL